MQRPLVLSIDDNYLIPAQVLIHSLHTTFSLAPGHQVVVLHEDSLCLDSIERLRIQITSYGWMPLFIQASSVVPDILPLSKSAHVSRASFYRLFAASLLSSEFDSALYIDVDVISVRSISNLFSIPLAKPIAAVDHFSCKDSMRLWGDSGGEYFQAGVLLIDLKWWREYDIERKFRQILENQSGLLRWWDQDVLNLAFKSQWQKLPWFYNVGLDCSRYIEKDKVLNKARIIHYDGSSKPWSTWSRRPYKSFWYEGYHNMYGGNFNVSYTKRSWPVEIISLFKHGITAMGLEHMRSKS